MISLKPLFRQPHIFVEGDVVECINTDPWPCDEFMPDWIRKGGIYRVVWTGVHPIHGDSVNVSVDPSWFHVQYAHHAHRFAHVKGQDGSIEELIARHRQLEDA